MAAKKSKSTKAKAPKKKAAAKKTTTKKAPKKAAKADEKKAAPTTGQSAPPVELGFEDLNDHEQKVVLTLNGSGKGKREAQSLNELTDSTGFKKSVGQKKGYIRAKNATRRLIRSTWIEHAEEKGKGTYRITAAGRKRLVRVGSGASKKKAKASSKKTTVTRKKGGGKKVVKAATKKHVTANPNAVAPLPPAPSMVTPPIH